MGFHSLLEFLAILIKPLKYIITATCHHHHLSISHYLLIDHIHNVLRFLLLGLAAISETNARAVSYLPHVFLHLLLLFLNIDLHVEVLNADCDPRLFEAWVLHR